MQTADARNDWKKRPRSEVRCLRAVVWAAAAPTTVNWTHTLHPTQNRYFQGCRSPGVIRHLPRHLGASIHIRSWNDSQRNKLSTRSPPTRPAAREHLPGRQTCVGGEHGFFFKKPTRTAQNMQRSLPQVPRPLPRTPNMLRVQTRPS